MARRARSNQHILERRAGMLADRLTKSITDLSTSLQAANGRVPFKTKLSTGTALDWWSKNINTPLGQRALSSLDPLSVMKLHTALSQFQNKNEFGMPVVQGMNQGPGPLFTGAAGGPNPTD